MAYGYCTPLVQCTCFIRCSVCTGAAGFPVRAQNATHDNVLNRQEMVLIGMLLIAQFRRPGCWWDNVHPIVG